MVTTTAIMRTKAWLSAWKWERARRGLCEVASWYSICVQFHRHGIWNRPWKWERARRGLSEVASWYSIWVQFYRHWIWNRAFTILKIMRDSWLIGLNDAQLTHWTQGFAFDRTNQSIFCTTWCNHTQHSATNQVFWLFHANRQSEGHGWCITLLVYVRRDVGMFQLKLSHDLIKR
jgi:hypothetical protein